MLASIAALMIQSTPMTAYGLEAMEVIRHYFTYGKQPGYCDAIEPGKGKGPLFNWGAGVLISALNGAARHDKKWKIALVEFLEASQCYFNNAGPVSGYDVLPLPKPKDRYYDDNAWMALALVESSELLGDDQWLQHAKKALDFALSGIDSKLGGGIYWRENEKRSKNTCSNAPTAAACLAYYEKCGDKAYLNRAVEIYAWTRKYLQDPSDGLMWDSISLTGKIDKTKWSYNTALMIRTAAELGRLTNNKELLVEAERMADASEKKWLVDGRLHDTGRFAHLLLESWSYVPNRARGQRGINALKWLHEQGRDSRGLYGGSFWEAPGVGQSRFELIDQASAARAFFVADGLITAERK